MIKYPQRLNRKYNSPQVKKEEEIPDGTEIRCPKCQIDLIGIFNKGRLEIKHRGREIRMSTGVMDINCRNCGHVLTLNLKKIRVNYVQQTDEEILATEAALKLATEKKVNLQNVVGSGKGGQILIGDVREFLDKLGKG